ncbi:MAG TPA: hypothetical protein VIU40_14225 [Geobacteraceae bacterium]
MNTLFLSFLVAIGGAVGLVTLSRVFDLETYTTRIFPLIPILYAIVYEAIEKKKSKGRARSIPPSEAREEMKTAAVAIFQNITFERIIIDVGVAFLIKFCLEIMMTAVYLSAGHSDFATVYGAFNIETVGRFLRGDHPWLAGGEAVLFLALIAFITSLGTGYWIGNTTKAMPILEGVIAGAVVTVITTMTNLIVLYRHIEKLAEATVESFGYVTHVGFAVVVTLQVLLYGLWSGMACRDKAKRASRAAEKKARRSRK